MTEDMKRRISNHIVADKEERELETLVSVLGSPKAQRAVDTHTLPEMVAREQGHGMDYRNAA
jgi:hypothetical protein